MMNLSIAGGGTRGKKSRGTKKNKQKNKYVISAASISEDPLAGQSCNNFISE